MDYTRVHRLLRILMLIQSDGDWTARRLAEACGVNIRTIYRDMGTLEAAGVPYYHDTQSGGYRVRRDFFMPPTSLTLDEALSLIALAERIGAAEQIPLMLPAGRAIEKVRSQLPAPIRQQIEKVDRHVSIKLAQAGPHEGFADVYEGVRAAIAMRRALRCRYESLGSSLNNRPTDEPFEFRPYALFFCQRAWYVIGHHGARREVRSLKLNRFLSLELTDKAYRIPSKFTLDDHLGNAWRMIRGDKTYDVELRFDAEFAETIADTHWHATQRIRWHDDGSITFRCRVDGLEEIVWWVLSMGPHCHVRKPAELRRRVADLAARTAARYRRPD